MESKSLERRALKEILVWLCTITAGYAVFSSFEPLYESARRAAAKAGLSDVFALEAPGPAQTRPDAKLAPAAAALNLRGTLGAGKQAKNVPAIRKVTLNANTYGHFNAQAEINGQQVEFMTDTGATYVALSYETAVKLGIASPNLRFTGRSTTANGVARVASVVLDAVRIGEITIRNVQAVIAEPGRMSQNLLGMSFIGRLSGFELSGTKLVMTE